MIFRKGQRHHSALTRPTKIVWKQILGYRNWIHRTKEEKMADFRLDKGAQPGERDSASSSARRSRGRHWNRSWGNAYSRRIIALSSEADGCSSTARWDRSYFGAAKARGVWSQEVDVRPDGSSVSNDVIQLQISVFALRFAERDVLARDGSALLIPSVC